VKNGTGQKTGESEAKTAATSSLTISMHDNACHLECSYGPFMTFARSYLKDLLGAPGGKAAVKVRLRWGEAPGRNWNDGKYRRGRRILQDTSGPGTSRLLLAEILDLPGLQIEAGWQENTLVLQAYYQHGSRLAKAAGRFNPFLPKIYVILIYYLVYFPLFYSLYLSRGWHLMHAGAVGKEGPGWVFAGLPGSGKSTFILSLLSHPDMQLLSDNLLMFDSSRVYACPEPFHLSKESMKVVGKEALERLETTGRIFSHQRSDFLVEEAGRAWETHPEALFFLGLAGKREHRRLPKRLALERLAGYDRLAKEVNAYEQFAASLDLLVSEQEPGRTGRISDKKDSIAALVSKMDCCELWIEKGEDLSQSRKWIEEIIEGREEKNEHQEQAGAVHSR
jgi:hypothetical protein